MVPTGVRRTNDQEVHSGITLMSGVISCSASHDQKTSMLVSPSLIAKTPQSPRSERVHSTRQAVSH